MPPLLESKFCQNCAAPTQPGQAMCTKCGQILQKKAEGLESSKKLVAGLFGILLNGLGIHKFYLGYTKEGVIMLLVTVIGAFLTCGIASTVMVVIGLIEGIIYLTKDDAEFDRIYVQGRKPWF